MRRMAKVKQFRATLERMPGNLGWTIIYLPFDVNEVWGTRAQVRVRGEVNGDRKSTRLNSSHIQKSRMPSSA